MEKNVIDEYDYISVTVKSVTADKVTAGYETLGWECVKAEEHSRFFDELVLTLRRPHVIDHKDERQLIQVYLENAFNALGRLATRPHPKTTCFLVVLGLLLLATVTFGVCTVFLWGDVWFTGGIVLASAGALLFVPYGIVAKKIYDSERVKESALEKKYYQTISAICRDGTSFVGDDDAK